MNARQEEVVADASVKRRVQLTFALLLMSAAAATRTEAQSLNPGPPGPFVVDAREA